MFSTYQYKHITHQTINYKADDTMNWYFIDHRPKMLVVWAAIMILFFASFGEDTYELWWYNLHIYKINKSLTHFCYLCRFLMCTNTEELRKRADWEGKGGSSRAKLMEQLQGN